MQTTHDRIGKSISTIASSSRIAETSYNTIDSECGIKIFFKQMCSTEQTNGRGSQTHARNANRWNEFCSVCLVLEKHVFHFTQPIVFHLCASAFSSSLMLAFLWYDMALDGKEPWQLSWLYVAGCWLNEHLKRVFFNWIAWGTEHVDELLPLNHKQIALSITKKMALLIKAACMRRQKALLSINFTRISVYPNCDWFHPFARTLFTHNII